MALRIQMLPVLTALLVALGAAASAHAAPVTVVDGDRAVLRDDPFVPPAAETRLIPPSGVKAGVAARASSTAAGRRAVSKALRTALRKRRISRSRHRSYVRIYARARGTLRKLRGGRRGQLSYVVSSLERMAQRGRLSATRMPALFLQLDKNALFWRGLPYPAQRAQVTFRGSEILYEYYPGEGLQIQPLATFKKANLMHGACARGEGCSRARLKRLLDEMTRIAVRRNRRFIAWEYMFDFGGGAPPWMSGMAQATAIQALGRAAKLLDEPGYLKTARKAVPAFQVGPPSGVRTTGPFGGPHYLQYSFAPRLFIFNAFLQSLIGLYDYAKLTDDAKARSLFEAAEPEAKREIPASDVGDWSRYSYRGRESDRNYHELLREFLQSLCNRLRTSPYCSYAKRFTSYQRDPAELELLGPETATKGRETRVRFRLDKLSAVQVVITKGGATSLNRVATFRRGTGSFAWKPGGRGTYRVSLAAKELRTGRSLRTRTSGEIEVGRP